MEEGVIDRKDDRNKKSDEDKEAECLDETSPAGIEEGVYDKKDDNNEKNDEEKIQNA